jgi:hypothetical protein
MSEIIETINKLQMVAFALNEQYPNSLQALEDSITVIQGLDWDIGALRVENFLLKEKLATLEQSYCELADWLAEYQKVQGEQTP